MNLESEIAQSVTAAKPLYSQAFNDENGEKMRKQVLLVVVALLSVNTSALAGEKQKDFNFNSQIGIAEITPTGDGCLTISNSTLPENQKIKLVIIEKQQKVIEKEVHKKLKASCSRNPETPPDASFYSFSTRKEEHFDPADRKSVV